MTPNPICIDKDTGLKKALQLMVRHSVRHLMVLHEGRLVGVVSKSDLEKFDVIKNLGGLDRGNDMSDLISVDRIMTRGVHTLYEDESIKDAAEMLTLGAYHALPVVNFDNEVIGIVSSTDLILYLLKCMKEYGV